MSAIMPNPGAFDDNFLYRAVGLDFPVGEFTFMWHVFFITDRVDSYQTYCGIAKTVFVGDQEYIIMGFDGTGTPSHNFAIGSLGSDTYALDTDNPHRPVVGRWFNMAFVRRDIGGGDYDQFLYTDIANGMTRVSRFWDFSILGAFTADIDWRLVFGGVPYNTAEGIDGKMRSCKAWSRALTDADIILEHQTGAIVTSPVNLYGQWPMVSDGNDISGNARHLITDGVVTFDGEPDPQVTISPGVFRRKPQIILHA